MISQFYLSDVVKTAMIDLVTVLIVIVEIIVIIKAMKEYRSDLFVFFLILSSDDQCLIVV